MVKRYFEKYVPSRNVLERIRYDGNSRDIEIWLEAVARHFWAIQSSFAHSEVMMGTRIERQNPREGIEELPIETARGFELVDPRISRDRHHVKNSTFVRSIEEAAYLVEQGFSIRMGAPGKRPSLVSRSGLKIVRT